MHEKKLLSMATGEGGVNERWLWHGTSTLDPCVICRSMDGFDFRMVCGVGGRIAMSAVLTRLYGCGCGRAHCGYRGLSVPCPAVCAAAAVSGRTVW